MGTGGEISIEFETVELTLDEGAVTIRLSEDNVELEVKILLSSFFFEIFKREI